MRTETLQSVPVAVSSISQVQLQNNQVTELNKIGELAPQMVIGRATTGTGAIIAIRGISSSAVDSGLDQSVSMQIDGVSMSRGRVIESGMFDLQQVDVLQGPQALFFGKNSPAGVIAVHTADPTNDLKGYVKAGYEFVGKERYAEAAVGGPLGEDLKARIAGRYSKMDGWIKNVAKPIANPFQPASPLPGATQGDSFPQSEEYGGRLTVVWDPSDGFNAKFKLTGTHQQNNNNAGYSETYCANGQTAPTTLGVVQPDADCTIDRKIAQSSLPATFQINYPDINGGKTYVKSDLALASLTLNKSFDNVTITSTTGAYYQKRSGAHDGDYGEFAQIWDTEHEKFKMVNEELRVNTDFEGAINVVAGGYYEHTQRNWQNAPMVIPTLDPVAQRYLTTITISDNQTDSYSVFGQLRWGITDTIELDGGARYTHDHKQSVFTNIYNNLITGTGRGLRAQGVPLTPVYSGNNVSPEVTLTWKPDTTQTVYAAYKTGYKAGGISNAALLPASSTAKRKPCSRNALRRSRNLG